MKARQKSLVIFCAGLLAAHGGCQSAPRPVATPRPPPPAPIVERLVDPALIEELLNDAAQSYASGWLDVPEHSSAVRLYREVLALDPGNQEAARGLERIVERFVELATDAAERGLMAQARAELARARSVDPGHAAIAPTERQIELLTNARRSRMTLNKTELAARSAALGNMLAEFGAPARRDDCRVTISARNDPEGRWVYQQLSRGTGDQRIRASFEIASPPGVEILCFD